MMTVVVLAALSRVRAVLELIPSAVSSSLWTRPRWTKSKKRSAVLVSRAAFVLWLLIGGRPALLVISAIIYWVYAVDWITDHPLLTPPRSVLFLVRLAPVLVLLFFTFGYWSLDRVGRSTMPKAYVQIHSANTSESALVERYVIRSFANWLLVQDQDRTQVDWVRMEQVDRIEVQPDVRFPGLLCSVFGLWCRGHTLLTLTAKGAYAEPLESALPIAPKAWKPVEIHVGAVRLRTPLHSRALPEQHAVQPRLPLVLVQDLEADHLAPHRGHELCPIGPTSRCHNKRGWKVMPHHAALRHGCSVLCSVFRTSLPGCAIQPRGLRGGPWPM